MCHLAGPGVRAYPFVTKQFNANRAVAPPQSYFIDRKGVILSRQIGELTAADLDRQLAAILR